MMAPTPMATLEQLITARYADLREFSIESTVSISEIYKAMRGEPITLATAHRLADALGLPRDQLGLIEGLAIKRVTRKRKPQPE